MSAADLVTPNEPLAWAEARPILEQLTRELLESVREHSTPAVLSPEQIRVGNDGAVQLLDWSLRPITPAVSPTPLQFVQHMAILLLEGRPPAPGELHRSIRAPIPAHAVPMLDRLMGVRDPGPSLESFAAALEATRDRPRRVTFVQKLAYLWVFAVLHALGLLFMFTPRFLLESVSGADPTRITRVAAYLWDIQSTGPQTRLVAVGTSLSMPVVFWPAAWAIWAAIFRGGFAHQFTGLRLVRQDGRPASRLQCAFRVLIVWAPISLLLLANLLLTSIAAPTDIADIAWWVAGGLLVVFAELSLVYPRRSLHDWLAGTWLVPE